MKKKATILSIFLAAFMALTLNVCNVKAAVTGQDIVNYAMRFRGVPYVEKGDDSSGFDCSGFVQYVYRNAAEINLPRSTYEQIKVGTPVSRNELQPGDLVFLHTGHMGIYVGNGQMIHSPQTGDVVKVTPVYAFYVGRRIITDYCEGVDTNASPIKRGYRVCVSSVNVKRCASDSPQTLKTLNYGYVLDIYGEFGDWYLVARGDTQQWVKKN
ncbi:C40 family peptidase [Clostridium botulinum]|uniref:C40 family peptidase n=1 Tax=Clostridium botulinum TaxID=1491 RepID=UPI000D12EFD8|nr:C40 family peptidase [Clostridium botulinum]AVQ45701.1 hypothetical protein C7M60_07785 [Clostridium botulinum]AVQ49640.1 hypothetical protein C7M58_09950 [Clostridium botulinum]